MSSLPQATCQASIVRARLKHSWLENAVLNKTPENVIMLRYETGWADLKHFPNYAKEAIALAGQIESGFSPAQLVDSCTLLVGLPDIQFLFVRQVVHAAYLACFDVQGASQRLREAATRMQVALSALLGEWNKADEAISEAKLRTWWNKVLHEAESLRIALDALPKGIVLP